MMKHVHQTRRSGATISAALAVAVLTITSAGISSAQAISGGRILTAKAKPAKAPSRAGLIGEAARWRVLQENSFGGGRPFKVVYVASSIYDSGNDAPVRKLAVDERKAVEKALAPTKVKWTTDPKSIQKAMVDEELAPGSNPIKVEAKAAVLTLGPPKVSGKKATMYTALFCGGLCALSATTDLELKGKLWIAIKDGITAVS
jgi:hypothetical protein